MPGSSVSSSKLWYFTFVYLEEHGTGFLMYFALFPG